MSRGLLSLALASEADGRQTSCRPSRPIRSWRSWCSSSPEVAVEDGGGKVRRLCRRLLGVEEEVGVEDLGPCCWPDRAADGDLDLFLDLDLERVLGSPAAAAPAPGMA